MKSWDKYKAEGQEPAKDERIAELEAYVAQLETALWKFAEFGRFFDALEPGTPIKLPEVPEHKDAESNTLTAQDFCDARDVLLSKGKKTE